MHTIQNTLYVMTPQAYAHLENATVRIDVEREKKLQVPRIARPHGRARIETAPPTPREKYTTHRQPRVNRRFTQ